MTPALRWSAPLLAALFPACEPAAPTAQSHAPLTAAPAPAPPPAAPAPGVMEGTPTARLGSLSVDPDGTLRDGDRILDRAVVPEIALTPDQGAVIYPRRSETGSLLWWRPLPDGLPRVLSTRLTFADRPVIHPRGEAVYAWGNDPSERFTGLYRIALPPAQSPPARVTNVGLTSLDDPRFVPPPVAHDARFVDDTTLVYTGPDGPVAVRL